MCHWPRPLPHFFVLSVPRLCHLDGDGNRAVLAREVQQPCGSVGVLASHMAARWPVRVLGLVKCSFASVTLPWALRSAGAL